RARARAPAGGDGQGRGDRARLDHAAGPVAQHRRARDRAHDVGRPRLDGDGAPQGVLRLGAVGGRVGGGRVAHDHRHRARGNRVADGRRDLRGVQGDGELRDQARSLARRAADLPGDRHRDERDAARGEAVPPRPARRGVHPAPRAAPDAAAGGDGVADQADREHAEQRRVARGAL
ncbi:MAG: Transcription termination factor Rho, partial [uncultured Gemmatimonadaceae bacterium]